MRTRVVKEAGEWSRAHVMGLDNDELAKSLVFALRGYRGLCSA